MTEENKSLLTRTLFRNRSAWLMALLFIICAAFYLPGIRWGLPDSWNDDEKLIAYEAVEMFQNNRTYLLFL